MKQKGCCYGTLFVTFVTNNLKKLFTFNLGYVIMIPSVDKESYKMFSILGYAGYICAPLIIFALLGWGRAYAIAFFITVAMVVMFISSSLGLCLSYVFDPYIFNKFELPHFFLNDHLKSMETFLGMSLVPYIGLVDLARCWWHFGITAGGPAWWIPQLMAMFILTVHARLIMWMA